MKELLKIADDCNSVDTEKLDRLRRALLLSDRNETRSKGQRKLRALVELHDPIVSPLAHGGLAASYWWEGAVYEAIIECQNMARAYPFSPVTIWGSTLMIFIYKSLGMKREVFEAEGDKIRLMKKIILQADKPLDRIYALHELKKELEGRDLEESEHFTRELQELVQEEIQKKPFTPTYNEELN